MSAKPPVRPAPVRPAPVRTAGANVVPAKRKLSAVDVLALFAGLVLLAGIGYVAYRTQVVGDRVEAVLPFLFEKTDSEANPDAHPDSAGATLEPGRASTPKRVAPAGTPTDPSDPDNTYFGRRQHSPSRTTEPAPSN
jgi:hypothetical protein